jgi:hypothetical protein
MITIAIIVLCVILCLISLTFGMTLCLIRYQRWRKHYHPPVETISTGKKLVPTSNYDNLTYDAFRRHVQQSSSQDDDHGTSMITSDSCFYQPQVVFLGGEQQLTAIFA